MRSTLYLVMALGWAAWALAPGSVRADEHPAAPQPTKAEAEKLVADGDRLADQGDYSEALERYTEAYHAIVSGIRGQKFARRVLPNLLTREELGQEMLRMMKDEYTPEEIALMDASYKVFGLMPPEMSSHDLLTKLLTEEVAGFYDPKQKRMVLIRENGSGKDPGFLGRLFGAKAAFDKEEQKTTLAHEMTHALQDQLYDLRGMQKRIEKDDDMLLAFSAMVEGDATLLMYAEMDGGGDITEMDAETIKATFSLMSWMLPVAGGTTYRKAPAIFRESLIFPYFQGMVFCISLSSERGWQAIHAAYSDPPTSTEQILHPKKYTEDRDEAQAVTIPDLKGVVPGDWKHLGGNCLGEFQTSVMLKRLRSGRRAAEGWDGDRYEVFQHTDGRLGLVFVSVWDSDKDAEQFADSYEEYRQPAKSPGKATSGSSSRSNTDQPSADQPSADRDDASRENESAKESPEKEGSKAQADGGAPDGSKLGGERSIEVHGDKVWVIEGFDAARTKAIGETLSRCTFEIKRFPPAKP